jgi:hypothetical protein
MLYYLSIKQNYNSELLKGIEHKNIPFIKLVSTNSIVMTFRRVLIV